MSATGEICIQVDIRKGYGDRRLFDDLVKLVGMLLDQPEFDSLRTSASWVVTERS